MTGVEDTVVSGSLLLAAPLALLAGLISFASPCVLPLVPGYLSYVTGLSGADLASARRGRILLGAALFVAGFSAYFVSLGLLFGGIGDLLRAQTALLTRVLGALTIVLGLAFMGLVPGMQKDLRVRRAPALGLAGAPLLGLLFGLGWTPCIGPTLGAVQTLAFVQSSAGRGALLTAVYSAGLGLPFLLVALLYRRALGAVAVLRRHSLAIMRFGGALLVITGLLLVTGVWDDLTASLRAWAAGFTTVL